MVINELFKKEEAFDWEKSRVQKGVATLSRSPND